jgi:hypothetical protein
LVRFAKVVLPGVFAAAALSAQDPNITLRAFALAVFVAFCAGMEKFLTYFDAEPLASADVFEDLVERVTERLQQKQAA